MMPIGASAEGTEPSESTKQKMIINLHYEKGSIFQRPKLDFFVDGYFVGTIRSGDSTTAYFISTREYHLISLFTHGSKSTCTKIDISHQDDITVDISVAYADSNLTTNSFSIKHSDSSVGSEADYFDIDHTYFFTYGYTITAINTKRGSGYSAYYFDLANGIYVDFIYNKSRKDERFYAKPHKLYCFDSKYYLNEVTEENRNDREYYTFGDDGNFYLYTVDGSAKSQVKSLRMGYPILEGLTKADFYTDYPDPTKLTFD